MLNIYVFLLLCLPLLIVSYTLEPVELPSDISRIRVFTDEELANYDGSKVDSRIPVSDIFQCLA